MLKVEVTDKQGPKMLPEETFARVKQLKITKLKAET